MEDIFKTPKATWSYGLFIKVFLIAFAILFRFVQHTVYFDQTLRKSDLLHVSDLHLTGFFPFAFKDTMVRPLRSYSTSASVRSHPKEKALKEGQNIRQGYIF